MRPRGSQAQRHTGTEAQRQSGTDTMSQSGTDTHLSVLAQFDFVSSALSAAPSRALDIDAAILQSPRGAEPDLYLPGSRAARTAAQQKQLALLLTTLARHGLVPSEVQ